MRLRPLEPMREMPMVGHPLALANSAAATVSGVLPEWLAATTRQLESSQAGSREVSSALVMWVTPIPVTCRSTKS